MNCTPFDGQYDILDNKWGFIMLAEEVAIAPDRFEQPGIYIPIERMKETLGNIKKECLTTSRVLINWWGWPAANICSIFAA